MSWQKDIGTGFEYRVRDRLNELYRSAGFKAIRIWYSGAGLKKPYDVEFKYGRKLILGIEAKRSIASTSISMQREWIKRIGEKHVIIFAAGNFRGKKVDIFVLRKVGEDENAESRTSGEPDIVMKDKAKSVSINYKKHLQFKDPIFPFVICGSEKYAIEEFKTFFDKFTKKFLEA